MAGEWKFRVMDRGEKLVDPFQGQFFTTNIVGGITAALVRETIQNSLDARVDDTDDEGQPYIVIVRFALSGDRNALQAVRFRHYLGGLIPHLIATDTGLQLVQRPEFESRMPYLVIEDQNTIGLVGDPSKFEDSDNNGSKENFFWFWRNVGRSGKVHDARGRWGLGKAVYPKTSEINTYFGLTAREIDDADHDGPVALLMGESILKIHKLEGHQENYNPYGYYGQFADPAHSFFVSPLDEAGDNAEIDDFISDFRLWRKNDDDEFLLGLSLVIPFPSPEITRSELIKATIIQYFYPVLLNQLEVYVEDEETEEPIRISGDTLADMLTETTILQNDSINRDQLQRLIDFTKWIIEDGDNEIIELRSPGTDYTPAWRSDLFLDEAINRRIEEAAAHFEEGSRVGFRVPVKVHPVNGEASMAWFRVFMEKDRNLEEPDCHFIRDGITIVGVNPLKRKTLRAIVIIDDRRLSKLLGDAENPAHTEWSKDSPNFIGKYVDGDKTISFIINSLDRLFSWLNKPAEGLDEEVLGDVFFLPHDDENGEGAGDTEHEREINVPPQVNPPRNGTPVSIEKTDGGIVIKKAPNAAELPESVRVRMGYMRASGNPLDGYNRFDFDLGQPSIRKQTYNAEITLAEENHLEFRITQADFRVTITGFDPERDLIVKTNP